jgi:hypothetical protein
MGHHKWFDYKNEPLTDFAILFMQHWGKENVGDHKSVTKIRARIDNLKNSRPGFTRTGSTTAGWHNHR